MDNGEFRNKNEPANKKFMEEIEKGYIPNELVKKGITDLGIEMDDHRDENYEPPKEEKKFQAFTGLGKSISSVNTEGLHVNKNATSNVDRSKPTCKVNIRLFNGEVVSEDFNLNQTLQDVINFVKKNQEVIISLCWMDFHPDLSLLIIKLFKNCIWKAPY